MITVVLKLIKKIVAGFIFGLLIGAVVFGILMICFMFITSTIEYYQVYNTCKEFHSSKDIYVNRMYIEPDYVECCITVYNESHHSYQDCDIIKYK